MNEQNEKREEKQEKKGFAHERLDAYKTAIEHFGLVQQVKSAVAAGSANLLDQLDRASESIVLNIAEGCGKKRFSKDRAKYYRIASASAAECAAAWDLLAIRCNAICASARCGKQLCIRIAKMLSKMG